MPSTGGTLPGWVGVDCVVAVRVAVCVTVAVPEPPSPAPPDDPPPEGEVDVAEPLPGEEPVVPEPVLVPVAPTVALPLPDGVAEREPELDPDVEGPPELDPPQAATPAASTIVPSAQASVDQLRLRRLTTRVAGR